MSPCVAEPVSWLRLEAHALGARDPALVAHLAACPACRGCLASIADDAIELPALLAPPPARRAKRAGRAMAGLVAIGAVIALVVALRPDAARPGASPGQLALGVKGAGEVVVELVRERAGAIVPGAHRYAPGDRWKVVVTCAPRAGLALAIEVAISDGAQLDRPLAPARLACGNRVVVPGAFTLTGRAAHRVCARIAVPDDDNDNDNDAAIEGCVIVTPEE